MVFLLHKLAGIYSPEQQLVEERTRMRLLKNVIFSFLIISSGFCYAWPPSKDQVTSIMDKVYNDPTGKKVLIANILIKNVNNDILDQLPKAVFNKILSNMVKRYGADLDKFSSLLVSSSKFDVPNQSGILMEIYLPDAYKTDRLYVEEMIAQKGMSTILKMDKNTFNEAIAPFYPSKAAIVEDAETNPWPSAIKPSGITTTPIPAPEEIRMSGYSTVSNSTGHRNDQAEGRPVTEKLGDYILGIMDKTYANKEQMQKDFKAFRLKDIFDFARKSVEEMTTDLFYNGHLSEESINILSDEEVFKVIIKAVRVKKDITEFCNYLHGQVEEMIQEVGDDHLDLDWEKGLVLSEKKLYEATATVTDARAMIKWFKAQVNKGTEPEAIVKQKLNLFSNENMLVLLDEIKSTESLDIENTLLSQFEAIIEAKQLNNCDMEDVASKYEETKTYLKQQKDLDILNKRLGQSFNTEKVDVDKNVNKVLDLFIKQDGKLLTEEFVKIFFGTGIRDFKDGLNYQVKQYMEDTKIKSKFLVLSLLVLGSNDYILVKDKQVPIERYITRFMAQGNRRFLFALKDLDINAMVREGVKRDVATKVSERVKTIIELEKKTSKGME